MTPAQKVHDSDAEKFLPAVREFAAQVKATFDALAHGEPEEQLRAPLETLFAVFSQLTRGDLLLKGESLLGDRLGRPDFAAHAGIVPIGFVELKAPGKGADPARFTGHDRAQWERFKRVPNLLYGDGDQWSLYRNGERVPGALVRFSGSIVQDGKDAITGEDAANLFELFAAFVSWQPVVPQKPAALAAFLAPCCRLLRDDVLEALNDPASPMHRLKDEVKNLLFPDASNDQFADAYAQTVLFALLLARMGGADVLKLADACAALEHTNGLLSRSLQFLTDRSVLREIEAALDLVRRVVAAVDPASLCAKSATDDPWLFFYEHFLAAYDPELRKNAGAYYTPLEVVRCQVRLIDEILVKKFHQPMGFVEHGVATLDPAVGTGTYLLGIMEHALRRVAAEEGPGAVKGGMRMLATNLHGFEWLVGPYAVAQLRFAQALASYGVPPSPSGLGIYLTNTLESPHAKPPMPSMFHEPIAKEHRKALFVKEVQPVLVCIGNPPYDRHGATEAANHAATGGWVRYGDGDDNGRYYRWIEQPVGCGKAPPILDDFLEPVRQAGLGVHLKNLYNLYVYFIRWALWKTFEHERAPGPGVVSFITASSYLDGDAFVGLREHLRRTCDHVDIIDLGGEGRGTRQNDNVFAIQTPVCILVAWRRDWKAPDAPPAEVRYVRFEGTRAEKLHALDAVQKSADLAWEPVPNDWQAPFKPAGQGTFFTWPQLTDLMPWQHTGGEIKRSWPIAPEKAVLKFRWDRLAGAEDTEKVELFKETRDRTVNSVCEDILQPGRKLPPLLAIKPDDMNPPVRYGFRSFDRQWIIPDGRVGDYFRPALWLVCDDGSKRQCFFASSLTLPLGQGPALTVSCHLPDRHYFCNRGGKDILPLYRDRYGLEPNFLPGLLELLSRRFKHPVSAAELAGYLYAVLAQPAYSERFQAQLARCELRVPLTKDAALFTKVAAFGQTLLWLHTYGERLADSAQGRPEGRVPRGAAKCITAVPDTPEGYPEKFSWNEKSQLLQVGLGGFGPVSREVYEFAVSGFKVVQSWLGYRMKHRKGKKSSPLDKIGPERWTYEFTRELLELLWVLERTAGGYPEQAALLDEILAGPLFKADEFPAPPDPARKPPAASAPAGEGGIAEQPELDWNASS